MTRDEAVKRLLKSSWSKPHDGIGMELRREWAGQFADAAEALGLIKFGEPIFQGEMGQFDHYTAPGVIQRVLSCKIGKCHAPGQCQLDNKCGAHPELVRQHELGRERQALIDCNCSCADECPQGHIGSFHRCRIPLAKATIDGKQIPKPVKPDARDVLSNMPIPPMPAGVQYRMGSIAADDIMERLARAGFKIVRADAGT